MVLVVGVVEPALIALRTVTPDSRTINETDANQRLELLLLQWRH